MDHVAQALVGYTTLIGGLGGGSKPALVNAAAVEAIGVGVIGVQLEPQARLQERTRHPRRCQAQQPPCRLQCGIHVFADILFNSLELLNGFRSNSHGLVLV